MGNICVNLDQYLRRYHLKIFLSLAFVLLRGTVCAILVEDIIRDTSVKLF